MAGFEDEQIEQFIRNWFRSAKDQENDIADQCWELLQRPEYAAAKELAQMPLLLTLLCAVYDKSLDLPKNRSSHEIKCSNPVGTGSNLSIALNKSGSRHFT